MGLPICVQLKVRLAIFFYSHFKFVQISTREKKQNQPSKLGMEDISNQHS